MFEWSVCTPIEVYMGLGVRILDLGLGLELWS